MSWARLRPHPGFVLIDDDGSARAYINCKPGPSVVDAWKERYPENADDIDQGLAECFPIQQE